MHGKEYRDSFVSLGAEVMLSEDNAEGTKTLVRKLEKLDVVVVPPLHGFSNERIGCHHESVGAYAQQVRTWVEAGGILYVDDANYSESLDWLQKVDEGLAVQSEACGDSGKPGSWVNPLWEGVRGPRKIEPSTTWGHLVLPDPEQSRWRVIGTCAHGKPVALGCRLGAGWIVASSVRGWEGKMIQNVWTAKALSEVGLEVMEATLPELFRGINCVEVVVRGSGTETVQARVVVAVGEERFVEKCEVLPGETKRIRVECMVKSCGRQRAEVRVGVGAVEVCCEGSEILLLKHFDLRPERIGDGVLKPAKKPLVEVPRGGDSYEMIVLGDTHYDAAFEVYHSKYQEPDERLNRIQREEFARNERLWRLFGPRLLRAVQKTVSDRTRLVLQVGDLVQGDCGDGAVHGRMLLDTLGMFHERFPSIPFLTVIGNHDIRGPEAESAYRKEVLPYLSKELGKSIESTTFSFMLGGDLVVCMDFNSPDVKAIQEAFDEHPEARYKFVLTHGPVIPMSTATSGWFFMGWYPAKERQKIRELFLQNDVIVLTGHEHAVGFSECRTDSGRISQLMANSVWSEESLKEFVDEEASPAEFGRIQEERKSEKGLRFVAEYKNAITRHWYAKGAGFMVLKISPEGVAAEFFGGDIEEPARTIKVREGHSTR